MGLLSSKISYSLFLPYLLIFILHASTTSGDPLYNICGRTGNYTANTTFESNLNKLLPSLSSNGSSTGFFNDTKGQVPDLVYGLVLCRGDLNTSECSSCIDSATQDIVSLCPNSKGAVVWYDPCLLHYSNQRFFSQIDDSFKVYMTNPQNLTDLNPFSSLLGWLMGNITQYAAYNSSARSFATGEVNFSTTFPKIYGMVQCTRDLSADLCSKCLQGIIGEIPSCCSGKRGARVLGASCNFRYELYSFYEGAPSLRIQTNPSTTPAPPPALVPPATNSTGEDRPVIVLSTP